MFIYSVIRNIYATFMMNICSIESEPTTFILIITFRLLFHFSTHCFIWSQTRNHLVLCLRSELLMSVFPETINILFYKKYFLSLHTKQFSSLETIFSGKLSKGKMQQLLLTYLLRTITRRLPPAPHCARPWVVSAENRRKSNGEETASRMLGSVRRDRNQTGEIKENKR